MSKITIKEVNGSKFELDGLSGASAVIDVKNAVHKAKGWEPATQKLILSGKILTEDAKTLNEYGWQANSFLVCMVSKKPAAAAAPAAPAPAPVAATPAPQQAAKPAAETPAAPSKPAASSAQPAQPSPSPAAAAAPAARAPEFIKEADVAALKDMGFVEADVRAALAAAFGNTDRAVEYLMSGIPESARIQTAPAPPSPAAASNSEAPAAAPAASGDFPILRGNPQILNELRMVSRDNPQAMGQYLGQLRTTNPQIIEEINRNKQGFLVLMREPVDTVPSSPSGGWGQDYDDDAMEGVDDAAGAAGLARLAQELPNMSEEERANLAAAMGVSPAELNAVVQMMSQLPPEQLEQLMARGMPGGGGGGGRMPGQQVIHLTQQELQSVRNLQELGFSQQACLEAYLACDKNEDLAANYLINSRMNEDD